MHPAWEHDDIIHGYWIVPGQILAGEYGLTDKPTRPQRPALAELARWGTG